MRIIEREKPKREAVDVNALYDGKVVDYKVNSFQTKRGQGFGLRLKIDPAKNIGAVYAFDFIGHDESGPFILRGSRMEAWLKLIFGSVSLDNVILENIKGRPCRFKVQVSSKTGKDKDTGQDFTYATRDVVDFYPVTSVASAKAPVTTKTSSTAPKSNVTEEDWTGGELL